MQSWVYHKVTSNQGSSWQDTQTKLLKETKCNTLILNIQNSEIHYMHFENMVQLKMFKFKPMGPNWKLIMYSFLLCTTAQSDKYSTGLWYIQYLFFQMTSITWSWYLDNLSNFILHTAFFWIHKCYIIVLNTKWQKCYWNTQPLHTDVSKAF